MGLADLAEAVPSLVEQRLEIPVVDQSGDLAQFVAEAGLSFVLQDRQDREHDVERESVRVHRAQVLGRTRLGGGDPAVGTNRLERGLEVVVADRVEDDAEARAVGVGVDVLLDRLLGVVDGGVRAEFLADGAFLLGGAGRDHPGADRVRDLDADVVDAARAAVDEHDVLGTDVRLVDQHLPGGERDHGKRGGLRERERRGCGRDHVGDRVFGQRVSSRVYPDVADGETPRIGFRARRWATYASPENVDADRRHVYHLRLGGMRRMI